MANLECKSRGAHFPSILPPISLLPSFWKILSTVLTNRLSKHLKHVISTDQVGFMKGRNIESCLHTIESVLTTCPNAYLLAVDFEKAFDSLSHSYLLHILRKLNFPDKFCQLINSFLSLVNHYW